MDTNRFTQKSLEALQAAQQLAQSYGNAQVEQVHLLYALLQSGKRFDRSTDEQTRPEHAAGADRM